MKGEPKRKVISGMDESDDSEEERLQEHRKSEDSEHGKQAADEALRSAKRPRSAPEAAGRPAHQQHPKEPKQPAASGKQKERQADTQLEADAAAQLHSDGHQQKTAGHADAAVDTPFAAATAGPTSVNAAKDISDLAVRHSNRPLKLAARQDSGAKAAVSAKASGSLDSSKPPRKFKKNDPECAARAREVWRDDRTAPWGRGLELAEGKRPAAPATEKPPQGLAAVNWGFWQFFKADPGEDDDEEQEAEDEEPEQDKWYRGVVHWFDAKKKEYWLCMEDGEFIKDQKADDLQKDVRMKEFIFCIPPPQQQQQLVEEGSGNQQQSSQQAAASGQQPKKRKGPMSASQQQQQVGDSAAAAHPAAPLPLVPPPAPVLAASLAGATAVQEDDESQQHQVSTASQEPATELSASAALALVMPAAAAAEGEHQAEPDVKQEQQQEAQQQQQEPSKQQQQPQKRQPPAQRKGPKVQLQSKQQQQGITSPRGGASSTKAAAAAASQPPRLAGTPPQQLNLGGLPEKPRKLAEQLQKLQVAYNAMNRAHQHAEPAMKYLSEQTDADAAGVAAMMKEINAHLNSQQQKKQGGAQQQQAGLGIRLNNVLSTWSKDDRMAQITAAAARCVEKLGSGAAAADKQGPGAAGNKQGSSAAHQQQQGRTGGVGVARQQQQHSKTAGTPTKAAVKQEMPSLEKQKYEQEAAAAAQKAEAAAAKIAELQAALKEQQAATAAAEKAAAQRSRDLKLLDRFHELVPIQLLDNPLRDKAVAMLAALLHTPVAMSPFAMAHQIEALVHEQHGLVGTGKHMYLQHIHFIWNVLGGKELQVAADAALKAEQEVVAESQAEGGRQLSAAELALRAKAAADAAVAAASAAMGVESGIAGPSAVRGALLEGKLSVVELFHETAASLGFDQQRDK